MRRDSRSVIHRSLEENDLYQRTPRPVIALRPLIALDPTVEPIRERIAENLRETWHEEDLRALQANSAARMAKIWQYRRKVADTRWLNQERSWIGKHTAT